DLGHDVTVFTSRDTGQHQDVSGLRIRPELTLRHRHDREVVKDCLMDIWHCMSAPQSWLALEAAPVFVTVYGNDFLSLYHSVGRLDLRVSDRFDKWLGHVLTKRLIGRALPRAQHVFSISRYTEKVFLRQYPACRGKTSIASVGLSSEDFSPH